MRFSLLIGALLCICQTAFGQTPSPSPLPCKFSGNLLRKPDGDVQRIPSDEMKNRAISKVDLDNDLIRTLDFKSTFVLNVLVSADGKMVCIKSVSGLLLLQKSVENAVLQWKFKPALADGKPVAYLGWLEFTLCDTDCGDKGFSLTLLD